MMIVMHRYKRYRIKTILKMTLVPSYWQIVVENVWNICMVMMMLRMFMTPVSTFYF